MRNQKYNINFIKHEFEKEGYILLSKKYINNRQLLDFICPNGHKHKIIFGAWKRGIRCGKCFGTFKLDYTFIKQSFEKEGYILLSKDYIGNKQYLDFICPNGHKHKIQWISWQRGHRCKFCSKYNNEYTYDKVKQLFEKEGYVLLSNEYIDNNTPLNFICTNGHKHKISLSNWQRGQRCGNCRKTKRLIYDFIKKSFEKEKYTLLSNVYKNSRSFLNYICPSGHKHRIKWNDWQQGVRCPECFYINKTSKQEKEIRDYIIKIYKGAIIPNNRSIIKNPLTGEFLELDIWLPEIRKAIEYNGEHWHDNKYQKWKDDIKQKWCEDNGIELMIIDHSKWRKNKDFNLINNFIGV